MAERTRRQFLKEAVVLGGSALLVVGCSESLDVTQGVSVELLLPEALRAPGGHYEITDPSILAQFGERRTIFLYRSSESSVIAVSTRCTHQGCRVVFSSMSQEFSCPCHGARFQANGKVIRGSAKRDLFRYRATLLGDTVRIES
ncbi:MAG: hypothetical protein KatS3mg115_0302 [Candidatus Poribacteria bacterium]|nr:MAG: hypothetical protein KatS3mg115_0302 [Candidatus Poribacteria bacterium]